MNPEDPYGHVTAEDSFLRFKCLATMQESHPIRTVAFSPTGSVFCVGTNSKALRLCQFNEEENSIEVLHERASHHSGSVYAASWNSDSRLIATGSNDKTVKVRCCKRTPTPTPPRPSLTIRDRQSSFIL